MSESIIKSQYICGESYLIDLNAGDKFRADGKRVYQQDWYAGRCAFRCKSCLRPVNESVPGADFGEPINA